MAQERNLGIARAPEGVTDEDTAKAELQRQMEEARESISQTVTEIKDTVTNQYQHVKHSVTEALDWREQFRKRPVAWSVGALSVGFLVGYGTAAAVKGEGASNVRYPDYELEEGGEGSSAGTRYPAFEGQRRGSESRSYGAQSLMGAYGTGESGSMGADYRPSYSSGYTGSQEEDIDKPGLFERFKGTQAYNRLQDELSNLGNRFIEQLSTVGQEVVLPALFTKVKDLIGVDLSTPQRSRTGSQMQTGTEPAVSAAQSRTGTASSGTQDPYAGTSARTTAGGRETRSERGGSSYGTSENQSYGVEAKDRESYRQGSTSVDREA